jgi:hypothetical protein
MSIERWKGTKDELTRLLKYLFEDFHEKMCPAMSEKVFRRVFIETLARNVVTAEIHEMIEFIVENEQDLITAMEKKKKSK